MSQPEDEQSHFSIAITLGNDAEIGIHEYDEIFVRQKNLRGELITIALGRATTKRFIDIQNCLSRLIIHAVDA